MVMIEVGSPKMAREMLCAIQSQIDITQMPSGAWHSASLQKMIDQLDIHRPLGVDGKHGDLHTPTCGCEDKAPSTRGYHMSNIRRNPNDPSKLQIKEIVYGNWVDLILDEETPVETEVEYWEVSGGFGGQRIQCDIPSKAIAEGIAENFSRRVTLGGGDPGWIRVTKQPYKIGGAYSYIDRNR